MSVEAGREFVLSHHGVKGMKWGQRKSRVPPAPRATEAHSIVTRVASSKTKIKTEGGHNHPATEDAIKAALARQKLKTSGHHALTNAELQTLANRMNLERQVSTLIGKQPKSPARAAIDAALKDPQATIKTAKNVAETARAIQKKRR